MPDLAGIRNSEGIEGKRALFAFRCVEEAGDGDKYRSLVKKMPAYIKSNGLGQTLGFLFSKHTDNSEHKLLLDQFRQYLIFFQFIPENKVDLKDFIECLITIDPFQYQYATFEVLNLLNWLRRFAEGMLRGEADG